MSDQLIISVSREYGSAGHDIAALLAEKYSITLYDRNIIEEICEKKEIDSEHLHPYDEKPRNLLTSRSVNGHTNSVAENVANLQFEFIREKADSGESFVIVGRCAETILSDNKNLISVFITGNRDDKIKRTMEKYDLPENEARSKMNRHDKCRKLYHNSYSGFKWGDSRNYDMCINSSKAGVEGTADVIAAMVDIIVKNR